MHYDILIYITICILSISDSANVTSSTCLSSQSLKRPDTLSLLSRFSTFRSSLSSIFSLQWLYTYVMFHCHNLRYILYIKLHYTVLYYTYMSFPLLSRHSCVTVIVSRNELSNHPSWRERKRGRTWPFFPVGLPSFFLREQKFWTRTIFWIFRASPITIAFLSFFS